MKATINQIAKLAGVSTATVSNVINDKREKVSDKTRERVNQIIKEEGYILNRVASSMVTKRTKTLGLIIPDITNPFFPELARGVEDFASANDYTVILCNSDNKLEKEESYIEMLQEKMVDGIIITASRARLSLDGKLKDSSVPIVSVDREISGLDASGQIIVDNEEGEYTAVKYLLEKGYRKIVHLSGPMSLKTAQNRYKGFLKAYKEMGINPIENHLYVGDYSTEWGYEASKKIIENKESVECFTCGNDLIALGVYRTMHECKIKVPDEIGIVGYDDIYMASIVTPALTTVRQPSYEMGYKAAELIINKILHGNSFKIERTLKAELVIRESTI